MSGIIQYIGVYIAAPSFIGNYQIGSRFWGCRAASSGPKAVQGLGPVFSRLSSVSVLGSEVLALRADFLNNSHGSIQED